MRPCRFKGETARDLIAHLRAYVCYEASFRLGSTITGSAAEGDHHVRLPPAPLLA
jgi:hypothetical protein